MRKFKICAEVSARLRKAQFAARAVSTPISKKRIIGDLARQHFLPEYHVPT